VNLLERAQTTTTTSYIGVAAAIVVLCAAVRLASSLIPYSLSLLTASLEWIAIVLFTVAYVSAWALLPIGAFRPDNQFTLRGGLPRRVANVSLAALLLVAIHVVLGLALASARS